VAGCGETISREKERGRGAWRGERSPKRIEKIFFSIICLFLDGRGWVAAGLLLGRMGRSWTCWTMLDTTVDGRRGGWTGRCMVGVITPPSRVPLPKQVRDGTVLGSCCVQIQPASWHKKSDRSRCSPERPGELGVVSAGRQGRYREEVVSDPHHDIVPRGGMSRSSVPASQQSRVVAILSIDAYHPFGTPVRHLTAFHHAYRYTPLLPTPRQPQPAAVGANVNQPDITTAPRPPPPPRNASSSPTCAFASRRRLQGYHRRRQPGATIPSGPTQDQATLSTGGASLARQLHSKSTGHYSSRRAQLLSPRR
jgi:hypothetical protein